MKLEGNGERGELRVYVSCVYQEEINNLLGPIQILLLHTVQISRLLYYPFSLSPASIPINDLFVTPSAAYS